VHYLDELNPQQRQAAEHIDGPLLIVAGAGAGKTKTLTYRIRNLIQSGVAPKSILAITFTNKAAAEMRERLENLLPGNDDLPLAVTFHALGVRILRNYHKELDLPKYFTILDSGDTNSLLKEAMLSEGIDPKEWDPKQIRNRISLLQGMGETHDSIINSESSMDNIVGPVWNKYESLKRLQKSLDFGDLLSKTYFLLKNNPIVRKELQETWSHVHVDEYQDTNTIQYQISKLLLSENQHICAVGDSDQTIYSWRGATIRNILQFERDFPGAKIVVLEQNYRSSKTILDAASQIIKKNKSRFEKTLKATKAAGAKITVYQGVSAYDEAGFIAKEAARLINEGTRKPGDIAVLYRTNFQSRILEEAFLRQQVPYQLLGTKFFDRQEVKIVLAYVRYVLNPESLGDLKKIVNTPKRGIGKVSLAKILSDDADQLSGKAKDSYGDFCSVISDLQEHVTTDTASAFLQRMLIASGLQNMYQNGSRDELDRWENIQELVSFAAQYDHLEAPEGLQKLTEDAALLGEQDQMKDNEGGGAVRMMTIHASKGLEFPVVFVAGLEQGLFPSDRGNDDRDLEEERRLCYVALTRAEEKLYLSWAQIRNIFGQQVVQTPSEFLLDIPTHLTEAQSVYQKPSNPFDDFETNYLDW
jgi:DNA helicase-2/ATP-dependent DNA helicase PcrA